MFALQETDVAPSVPSITDRDTEGCVPKTVRRTPEIFKAVVECCDIDDALSVIQKCGDCISDCAQAQAAHSSAGGAT